MFDCLVQCQRGIITIFVKSLQLGVFHHDTRINSGFFSTQPHDVACRLHVIVKVVERQAEHHLESECNAFTDNDLRCFFNIFISMPAPTSLQNLIVCRLRPEFNVKHPQRFQRLHTFFVDIIGTSGASDAIYDTFFKIRLHDFQEIILHFFGKSGEIPTEKRHLNKPVFFLERFKITVNSIFNFLNIRHFLLSSNTKLIAINASERTCEFGKKDRYVIMFHFDFKIAKKSLIIEHPIKIFLKFASYLIR